MVKCLLNILFPFVLLVLMFNTTRAQNYNFTSGPIPMCDTSVFTANVSGIGQLGYDPWTGSYTSITNLCIDITSDHPQTLIITLTSPQGTNLLLSAFNGAGGSNYTNTCFNDWSPSIVNGSAPFTGNWSPQGGNFSVFDGEWGSGTWTITVIDTACSGGGGGGGGSGGTWTDGYFNGSGSGGFSFYFSPPPPCWGFGVPPEYFYFCPDDTIQVNLTSSISWLSFYTTTIYDPNGLLVSNPSSVTLPGTYYIDVYDPWSGCSTMTTIDIIVLAQAALGPDQNISLCSGTSINLNTLFPLSGFSRLWSLNGTNITNSAASNASTPGVYQVIAYNTAGCNDTALVTLTTLPGVSLGPNQSISSCGSASVDLTGFYNTSGLVSNWTSGGNPVANPSSVSTAGVYTVVATNSNGCTGSAQVTLSILPQPSLGADQLINICSGSTLDLTGLYNTGTFSANWTLNGNTVVNPASVNVAGAYMLIASSSMSCADTAVVTLNITPTPNLGPDQNFNICSNSPVDLNLLYNTSAYTSTWTLNGNVVTNPGSVNISGTYILIASTSNGCADSALVIINSSQAPALGPDQNIDYCNGINVDLTSLFNTTNLSSNWFLNANPVANPANVSTPGSYNLVVTNSAGCADTANALLTQLPTPSLGPDQYLDICSNTPVDLTTLYSTSGYTTLWTMNGNVVSNPANINTSGTYTLIVTETSGCTDTAEVTVSSSQAPALGQDLFLEICSDDYVDLNSLYNTGGLIVNWSLNGVTISNTSNVNNAGSYQLIATNNSGCIDTAVVNINVNTVPVLGPDQTISICSNSTVDLTTLYNTSGLITNWINNGTTVSNPANISSGGIYTLNAVNSSGCSASAEVTIIANTAPDLGNDQNISLCAGNTLDLTSLFSISGLTVDWTTSGLIVNDPSNINTSGLYTLIATNNTGCSDTAMVNVVFNNLPVLGPDQTFDLCPWMSVDLSSVYNIAGFNTTYYYNGSVFTNYASVNDSGVYVVEAIDINGCSATASVIITNVYCECTADFEYSGYCLENPFNFKIIADSAINDVHWQFNSSTISDNYSLNPNIYFSLGESTVEYVTVTMDVNLSCGNIIIQKEIEVADCSCPVYLPTSFTPNSDGINDLYGWQTDCRPESFSIEIYNRFGQIVFHSENHERMWNGRFQNEEAPSGLYVVKLSFKMPFGKEHQLVSQLFVFR